MTFVFCLLLAFLLVTFAQIIYISRRCWQTHAARLLVLLLAMFAIYYLAELVVVATRNVALATFSIKVLYFSIATMPAIYLHTLISYKRVSYKKNAKPLSKGWIFVLYLPTLALVALLPTNSLIAGVQKGFWWGFGRVEGTLFGLLRLYLAVSFVMILGYCFLRLRRVKERVRKNELRYLVLSAMIPIVIVSVITFGLQRVGINSYNIVAQPAGMMCLSVILTYAISRRRLFDLTMLIPVKTKQHLFHDRLKQAIQEAPQHVERPDLLVDMLSALFKCDVAMQSNRDVYASQGSDQNLIAFAPEQWLLALSCKGYRFVTPHDCPAMHQNNVEALIPFYVGSRPVGSFRFGAGFTDRICSTQDTILFSCLCDELEKLFFQSCCLQVEDLSHTIDNFKKPLNICTMHGSLYCIHSGEPMKATIVDLSSSTKTEIMTERYSANHPILKLTG